MKKVLFFCMITTLIMFVTFCKVCGSHLLLWLTWKYIIILWALLIFSIFAWISIEIFTENRDAKKRWKPELKSKNKLNEI